jgi:hypothetical protein
MNDRWLGSGDHPHEIGRELARWIAGLLRGQNTK